MFVLEFLAFGAWGFWLLLVGSSAHQYQKY